MVQVYLSMPDAPTKTPQQQLVNFKRVDLPANSKQQVSLVIAKDKLTYIDQQGKPQPYQGQLIVTVGAGQGIKIPKHQYITTEITLP